MRVLIITALAVTFSIFQNCSKTDFSMLADGAATNVGATNVLPDGPVICDPLGGGGTASNKNGLVGNLFYVPVAEQSSSLSNLSSVVSKAVKANGTIYMSQFNVPSRRWTEGFSGADAQPLKDDAGNKLVEYFGLKMQTELALTDTDEEGTYQLATISDDGMVVYTGTDAAPSLLAGKYDEIHPTRSDCSDVTFTLRKGERLPMNVIYYQGPRDAIAAVLAWRKVPSDADARGCSIETSDYDFFTPTADGSGAWEKMAAAGWKVIPSANLWLPETAAANPCVN